MYWDAVSSSVTVVILSTIQSEHGIAAVFASQRGGFYMYQIYYVCRFFLSPVHCVISYCLVPKLVNCIFFWECISFFLSPVQLCYIHFTCPLFSLATITFYNVMSTFGLLVYHSSIVVQWIVLNYIIFSSLLQSTTRWIHWKQFATYSIQSPPLLTYGFCSDRAG